MIVIYMLSFLMMTAGIIFLLGLTPEVITDDVMRTVSPKQTLRDKVLIAQGRKKSHHITKEIVHIKDALEATSKGRQFTISCAASVFLVVAGCILRGRDRQLLYDTGIRNCFCIASVFVYEKYNFSI